MVESKLRDLSMDFSVKAIKMCDNMKGFYRIPPLIQPRLFCDKTKSYDMATVFHSRKILQERLIVLAKALDGTL